MIDFNNLNVRRIIIHTINPKQNGQDTASAEFSNEILVIEDNVLAIIKVRLIDAAGRNSKAFELQIENTNAGSFYALSNDLNNLSDADFITSTSSIADLLADSQRKTSIPGGYLMIMNCFDNETNLPVHIVIKAEPHEALQFSNIDGHSQVNVLQKYFFHHHKSFTKSVSFTLKQTKF